ncbi:MAG: hypothetical protein ACFFG0_03365 [Candidatus Thorarchaeota archaeon]
MITRKYECIRNNLKTFDLVFFKNNRFISFFHGYSHIAIVVRYEDLKEKPENFREGSVLLFESTSLNKIKDAFENKSKRGVQFVYMSDKLKTCSGQVFIRRLAGFRTPEMLSIFNDFVKEVENRPYEKGIKGIIELIHSCFQLLTFKQNLTNIFCVELVAELYQRLNLISKDKASNNYKIKDFAKDIIKKLNYALLEMFRVVY